MRTVLKQYLSLIVWLTLRKHQPTIIGIVGKGSSSVAREYIYKVISTKYPSRRNIEAPEAEFSIPLTVLDYPFYPRNVGQWLVALVKVTTQLFTVRPYKHFLILELTALRPGAFEYWMKMLGDVEILEIENNKAVNEMALGIAEKYGIVTEVAEEAISKVSFPTPRLQLLPGPDGSMVIDATYYYLPIKLDSILELAEVFIGQKVLLTSDAVDSPEGWLVNPVDYHPIAGDLIVVLGHKTKVFEHLQKFIPRKSK